MRVVPDKASSASDSASDACSSDSQKNTEPEQKLFTAVEDNDIEAIEKIIKSGGASVNTREVYSGDTPIHRAVQKGNIEAFNKLLSLEADLSLKTGEDGDEDSLIFSAIGGGSGSVDMVKRLVEVQGNQVLRETNSCKESVVFAAAFNGEADTLKYLITEGGCADLINTPDEDGTTPVNGAALCNKIDCLKLLLENNADVTVAENDGCTVLHNSYSEPDTMQILLDSGRCGPIVSNKNKDGKTALQLAEADLKDAEGDEDYSDEERAVMKRSIELLKAATL